LKIIYRKPDGGEPTLATSADETANYEEKNTEENNIKQEWPASPLPESYNPQHVIYPQEMPSKDVNDNVVALLPTAIQQQSEAESETTTKSCVVPSLAEVTVRSVDRKRRCPSCGIVLLRKNLARHLRDQHHALNQPRQVCDTGTI
jgi:hypothetical protein